MWLIIILPIILISTTYWLYNEFFGYWRKRGVPHPHTLPFIGNMAPGISLMALLNRLNKAYNNYKDCLYVGFYQFEQPIILIRDIELIKIITTKEFSSFHDNPFVVNDKNDPIFAKYPFVVKGESWKGARAQITSGTTNDKIKNNMFHLIRNISKNLADVLNQEIKSNKPIDGKELSARYTTDVTAACMFGFEGNALNDKSSEFLQVTKRMFDTSILRKLKFLILVTKPYLASILKFSAISKDANQLFANFFQKIINHRETNNIVKNNYLDYLISIKTKIIENEFTNENILGQILAVIIGSIKTSSNALNLLLYELGHNYEVQTKLQAEIDNTMKEFNGEITFEALQNMNYLDMVVAESLRKYPPTMFLSRICTKEFTLPSAKGEGPDVILEIGTPVYISAYAIHHDPTYYPEPEEFIPERFSEEGKKSRPGYCYLPFGEGPRMCTGARFAVTQLKLGIISILSNFNIKVNPKTTPTFELDVDNTFINKKGGIWLDFDKSNR